MCSIISPKAGAQVHRKVQDNVKCLLQLCKQNEKHEESLTINMKLARCKKSVGMRESEAIKE